MLQVLKSLGKVDIKSDNKFTLVTIRRWQDYQGAPGNVDSKPDNKKTSKKHQKDTYKKDKKVKKAKKGKGTAPDGALTAELQAAWNALGRPFPGIRDFGAKRKRVLAARLGEPFWRDHWREALAKIPGSPFLRGENNRGWKANVDWFLRPESVTRILEGQYDGGRDSQEPPPMGSEQGEGE